MERVALLSVFLCIFSFSVFAGDGNITGKIVDQSTQDPIPQANVRILRQDSSFVGGVASNISGGFNMAVAEGNYILHISCIGFNPVYRNVAISNTNRVVDLGTVQMSPDNILLDAAVVTAKAPEMVVRGDTLEYNADSYKVTESAVVEDLLKKMPGVEIDSEGKITVNGRPVSKIMVEGEAFFSSDPQVASKNLPAKMVDKLQVLDRRSDMAQMTGFDDGEEETVINLTVKPGMKEGLLGNAFAGYGSTNRYEGNLMLNYMRNKNQYTLIGGINNTNNAGFSDLASAIFSATGVEGGRRRFMGGQSGITQSGNMGFNFMREFTPNLKLGGNIRYGVTDNYSVSKSLTQNILSSGNTLESDNQTSRNYSQNLNIHLRMEWEPDTLTKIIFSPQGAIYNNRRHETGDFVTQAQSDNETINYGESGFDSQGSGKNFSAGLDASRKPGGKEGRVFSVQLRAGFSESENTGDNLSRTFYNGTKPDDIIDQKFANTAHSANLRGYLSYVEPIGNRNFIQLSYQYQQNFSTSRKDTRTQDPQGNYTVLDEQYSRNLENNFVNRQIELNFQSVRPKYDYTVGLSVQPAKSRNKIFVGDSLLNDFTQKVVNYSPMAQFNYRWSRQHNLRVRYFGDTHQPTPTQLSPVMDVSNPLSITYGNPDLKPSFQHRLNIRYQNFNPEKKRSFNFFANAGYTVNDIVSSTVTDRTTGRKETTFRNVNGNWSANGRLLMNIPLKNIKFSIFSMSFAGYTKAYGFSNKETNLNQRLNLAQTGGLNYRSDVFDFGIRGNVNYNKVQNSLEGQQDQAYFDYGASANTTIYLPWNFSIESDINYRTNSGYADGFSQEEWLWNVSLSKQLFKQKNGMLRFKIYDILQQRSTVNRSVTTNYIRDTTTNTLTSYFMVHFVYRFNIFKGGATAADMQPPMRGERGARGDRF